MTGGQVANGLGSAAAMVTSAVFILTWTAVGRWWKTWTGRFMILKAGAISFTGIITVWLTLVDFASNWDPLRYIQAGLWFTVSVAFMHHTRQVWKINRTKGKGHE
jgi:hypothetical protein